MSLELVGALNAAAGTSGLEAAGAAGVLARRFPRTVRVDTGSVPGTSNADVTVTWPEEFPSTDYTVVAVVEQDVASDGLRVWRVRSRSTTGVVVNVQNTALTSVAGTLHVIAVHD